MYTEELYFGARLDYQPLFGRGARAPPRSLSGRDQTRDERAAEIEPILEQDMWFSDIELSVSNCIETPH